MVTTRSINAETPTQTNMTNSNSSTFDLPPSTSTRFVIPKRQTKNSSKAVIIEANKPDATAIEVPTNNNTQGTTNTTARKRTADAVAAAEQTETPKKAKRTRTIKPKPAVDIAQPVVNMINTGESSTAAVKTEQVKKEKVKTEKVKKEKVKKEPKPKAVRTPKPKKEVKPKKISTTPKLPPGSSKYFSSSMRSRALRAIQQRMFVVSRELYGHDNSCEKFEVLGSIGNNYTVSIAEIIKCTCMDYAIRRTHCKHILMVLFKVYRLECSSPLFKSLSTRKEDRIEARSSARVVDPSILVPEEIRKKILSISYQNHPDALPSKEETAIIDRRPLDTSDCPICFEEFSETTIETVDFCKTCGNNVHKECFKMWKSSKGSNVTCVYCRSPWVEDKPADDGSTRKKSVRDLDSSHVHERYYANFANELNIDRVRDISTYSKGNYRGYRYRDYDY